MICAKSHKEGHIYFDGVSQVIISGWFTDGLESFGV
jgi:hypothetical protein